MAIRLRFIESPTGGSYVALCAARSVAKPGDIDLDDNIHAALSNKFSRDYNEMFDLSLPGVYDDHVLVEREESDNPNRTWWDSQYLTNARSR